MWGNVAMPNPSGPPSASASVSLVYKELVQLELPDRRRIKINKLLGHGEFGHVFLGELGIRQVVVKLLKPQFLRGREEEAFLQESELLSKLSHPNIVQILAQHRRPASSSGKEGNEPYFVLGFAGLRTMRHMVELVDEDIVAPHEIISCAAQVASGLAYLHQLEIAHFDVKPENIFINSTGLYALPPLPGPALTR